MVEQGDGNGEGVVVEQGDGNGEGVVVEQGDGDVDGVVVDQGDGDGEGVVVDQGDGDGEGVAVDQGDGDGEGVVVGLRKGKVLGGYNSFGEASSNLSNHLGLLRSCPGFVPLVGLVAWACPLKNIFLFCILFCIMKLTATKALSMTKSKVKGNIYLDGCFKMVLIVDFVV